VFVASRCRDQSFRLAICSFVLVHGSVSFTGLQQALGSYTCSGLAPKSMAKPRNQNESPHGDHAGLLGKQPAVCWALALHVGMRRPLWLCRRRNHGRPPPSQIGSNLPAKLRCDADHVQSILHSELEGLSNCFGHAMISLRQHAMPHLRIEITFACA